MVSPQNDTRCWVRYRRTGGCRRGPYGDDGRGLTRSATAPRCGPECGWARCSVGCCILPSDKVRLYVAIALRFTCCTVKRHNSPNPARRSRTHFAAVPAHFHTYLHGKSPRSGKPSHPHLIPRVVEAPRTAFPLRCAGSYLWMKTRYTRTVRYATATDVAGVTSSALSLTHAPIPPVAWAGRTDDPPGLQQVRTPDPQRHLPRAHTEALGCGTTSRENEGTPAPVHEQGDDAGPRWRLSHLR